MATIAPSDTYALSDDHVAFRDTIRQIVRERVESRAAEMVQERGTLPIRL